MILVLSVLLLLLKRGCKSATPSRCMESRCRQGGRPNHLAARQILTDVRRVDHDARALSRGCVECRVLAVQKGKGGHLNRGSRGWAIQGSWLGPSPVLAARDGGHLGSQLARKGGPVVLVLAVWPCGRRTQAQPKSHRALCSPITSRGWAKQLWLARPAGYPKGTATLSPIGCQL
jgi:hypothetical protein